MGPKQAVNFSNFFPALHCVVVSRAAEEATTLSTTLTTMTTSTQRRMCKLAHMSAHTHMHAHTRFDKHTMQEGHRLVPKGGERGWGDAWHLETLVSYVRVCFCKSFTMGTNI